MPIQLADTTIIWRARGASQRGWSVPTMLRVDGARTLPRGRPLMISGGGRASAPLHPEPGCRRRPRSRSAARGSGCIGDGELDPHSRVTETAFAQFLCPTLDPADREGFAPILARRGAEAGLFKIDATAMRGAATLPGVHVAPTVTLLERGPRGFAALGIRVDGRLFTPGDGDAWELMKYFVLQSCAMQVFFLQHPRVHFPYDAIAAITSGVLPAGHRLRRLLSPHFGFQLAQDFAALYVTRSVAHNNQDELYTPYPTLRSGFLHLMKIGYEGMPGNSAYPRWSFQIGAPRVEQEYGRFLATYWDSIFRFTSEVLARVSAADPAVARWADACAQWVRGFPDAATLAREGTLAAAVATIIHNVSVVHTSDHHSLFLQPIRKVSLRLRVPPPERAQGFVLDRKKLVTREDVFRYHLGREMYVAAHVVRALVDVDYGFDGDVAPGVVSRFHDDLRATDRPSFHRFAPLSRIAASIQF